MLVDARATTSFNMLVEGLVTEVGSDTWMTVLTGVMVDVDMMGGVETIVVTAVVTFLKFSALIAYALDVMAGAIICCTSDIGVVVLTDTNVIFLTAPSEEAMPSC